MAANSPPHSGGGGRRSLPEGLIEFANHFRQPAAPGIEVIETPRYRITLQPDYPIPGPNSVAWVRCTSAQVDEVVNEVHAILRPRRLPVMWTLDPDTEPADFGDRLARFGVLPDGHSPSVDVMILPVDADLPGASTPGLAFRDALADAGSFGLADEVNAKAFRSPERDPAQQEIRRTHQLAAGNRRVLLATLDGEPAGSAGITLFPPHGAILNGGAVLDRFRGRGVYRALVAERLRMAHAAGVAGVQVWGGPMSAPILRRLGFETVGWRKFYVDTTTV